MGNADKDTQGVRFTYPRCPLCNQKTTIRNGPHGQFYSCFRFPACDGKVSLTEWIKVIEQRKKQAETASKKKKKGKNNRQHPPAKTPPRKTA